jgi:hypothetical protein
MFALSHKLLLLDEGEWLISCHATLQWGEEPSVPMNWVGGPKAVIDGEVFFPFCAVQIEPSFFSCPTS